MIISWAITSLSLPLWLAGQRPALFSQVNSSYDERYPVLSPDGQTLYFVRDRHPNNMGLDDQPDIWYAVRKGAIWGAPIHMGLPVNNLKPNRLAGVGVDGRTLYLAENDGLQGWINITRRRGRGWSSPQAMLIERFVPGATGAFTVSSDEKYLIIASEQTEGEGDLDLYVAFRLEDRRWSHPVNLGPTLNTPGREAWAMLAADGQTLYLASDAHPGGAGGLDLWMSRRQDNSWQNWTDPINLGPAVNTGQDEISLAIAADGRSIILDRLSQGQRDLVQATLPEDVRPYSVAILSGVLKGQEDVPPANPEIFYRFLQTKQAPERTLELEEGSYHIIVPLNWGAELYGNAPGYLPLSERFEIRSAADQLDTPNPQIAAWAGMNNFYWQEEEVIYNIQRQLQVIQSDKAVLEKRRRAHRLVLAEKTYEALENEDIRTENPEIEALESRFNIYQRQFRDTLSMLTQQTKVLLPGQPAGTSGGEAKKNFAEQPDSEETAKLKKQFREKRPAAPQSPAIGEEVIETPSFKELKVRAEKELTYEMLPRIQAELVQELFPAAWRNLQQNTTSALMQDLIEEEDSIRIHIRQGLGQFIMAPDAFENYAQEASQWWRQLKLDLKNVLRQEVRAHLKRSLRPLVLESIRIQLEYEVKKMMEKDQQAALARKIRQQQEIENASAEVEQFLDQTPVGAPPDTARKTPSFTHIEKDLVLTPVEEGRIMILKNVRFLPDAAELLPEAYAELDRILDFLLHHKDITVEIRAHTHGWCDHTKANDLTAARSRLLADYFRQRQIPAARVRYTGLGKTAPLKDNDTLAGRAANQRIELKILSINE